MGKHTPGPWTITPRPLEYRIDGPNGETVAEIDSTETGPEAEHNAQLIAAAPDLLAVAEHLRDAMRLGRPLREKEAEALDRIAGRAIAKAIGEANT